jgi:exodeoxyribonuclease VII large subunit
VGELTRRIAQTLAGEFGGVRVMGEVSQLKVASSGHWYFTLGDTEAILDCVMFKGWTRYLGWEPAAGERVEVTGDIDVYAPRGRYNMVVRKMVRAGEGDRRAALEALKRRLAAEGLTDPTRKRKLPFLPKTIGIATSPTGAALQDMLRVIQQRFPGTTVILAPCLVQGVEAPLQIARAIRLLASDGRAEVIIVGRGGGSSEDLAAFDDESVARAIAASPVPVVSAVGHETDISVADLVADLRAATPTHAAELVVPERDLLRAQVDSLHARMKKGLKRELQRRKERVSRIRLPTPLTLVALARGRTLAASSRLFARIRWLVTSRQGQLGASTARLQALDPKAVLHRGYAMVLDGDGRVRTGVGDLRVGAPLVLVLGDGRLRVRVEAIEDGG